MIQSSSGIYGKSALIPAVKETLWLIESGIVRTTTSTEQGKVTALGYWSRGDVVGQPLNTLETLEIECITDVQAVPLLTDEWSSHLPAILRHSQRTTQLMSYVLNENIAQRLVNILGWLGSRFGVQLNNGLLIDLPMTHFALSELIGSTRVTVTRLLGGMVKEGVLLQYKRSRLLLLKDLNSIDVKAITCQLNPHGRTSDQG
jgi:CRP-like cAMP-binding protein